VLVVWVLCGERGAHLVSDVHSDFRVPFFARVRYVASNGAAPFYATLALLEESVLAAFAGHMALRFPSHPGFEVWGVSDLS
jgi:hypothetical protein